MILELVGSRVLAPYLGTSIFVWTSVIGIILGSLSLGYWWGGKIADRKPDIKFFSFIILLSAIFTGIIVLIKEPILIFIQNISDIRIGAVIATIFLFTPASILLGMVSPYAARLKMQSVNTSGAIVGKISAVSTIGSIIGTFLAGFFLVAHFGSTKIIILLAIILVLTSALAFFQEFIKSRIITIILLILSFGFINIQNELLIRKGVIDIDTQYNRALIYESKDEKTGRPIRILLTGLKELQSAMFLDKDNELVFEYTKYYRLAKHFNPEFKKALFIGGGGYSFPKDYLKRYQNPTIDVVEIDPKFTTLAQKYFGLKDNPRLNTYHEDGRTFINRTNNKYDVIYLDVFRSYYSLPYYLTSKETVQKLYDVLNDSGVIMLNIISSIEGPRGQFLRAEYATYKEVFPQIYILPVDNSQQGFQVQNLILVAIKSNQKPLWTSQNKEFDGYLKHLWTKEISNDMPILTDDFAPVDQYIIKLMEAI